MGYVIGVYVGGTFTDAVGVNATGRMASAKTPRSPPWPFRGEAAPVLGAGSRYPSGWAPGPAGGAPRR
jgi:hypothetical protein